MTFPVTQLAPVPAALPPGARRPSGTLTERSIRSHLVRLGASPAAAEYRLAATLHAVAVGGREGAWFAYETAAHAGARHAWAPLVRRYRAALASERVAEARLRCAVDALTGAC
jgi:hypothetical protein